MPEVSVVITYYNSSPFYLRKCLDSVIEQTFKDFEAIIVCNEKCCKQYWMRIKEEYEKLDSRLKFVSIDKKGASAARNYAISMCQGKYLSIIDGDDYVENNFLSRLMEGMKEGTSDICICGVVDKYFPVVNMTIDRRIFFSMPGEFINRQYINFSVNKLYKLEYIREHEIRYPEGVELGEDALFLAQYYKYCNHISCIPDGLYHYIAHRTSLTHVFFKKYFEYERDVIDVQYKMFSQYPLSESEKEILYPWLFIKMLYTAWYYLDENPDYVTEAKRIFELKEMTILLEGDYKTNKRFNKKQIKMIEKWKKHQMPYGLMKKIM